MTSRLHVHCSMTPTSSHIYIAAYHVCSVNASYDFSQQCADFVAVLACSLSSAVGFLVMCHQSGGINSACDGRVLRVDVGVSKGCGNRAPEVLEIRGDKDVYRLQEGAKPVFLGAVPGRAEGKESSGRGAQLQQQPVPA